MLNEDFLIKSHKEIAYELENRTADEIIPFLENATPEIAQSVFFEFHHYIIADIFPKLNDELFKKVFTKVDTHTRLLVCFLELTVILFMIGLSYFQNLQLVKSKNS